MLDLHSVSEIESWQIKFDREAIISFTKRLKDFAPKNRVPDMPDMPIYVYARGDLHANVLESIRKKLTKRLLKLFPKTEEGLEQ